MGVRYSLYEYEIQQDPFPVYARLREDAPVYRNEDEDFWLLTRHADVTAAFRDFQRFSSANGVLLEPSVWGPQARSHASFLAMDPPEHTRIRGLVSKAFTPRRIAQLEPRVREIARRHLGRALQGGEFDLVNGFSALLPMDVIAELAGVPEPDRGELRRHTEAIVDHQESVHGDGRPSEPATVYVEGFTGARYLEKLEEVERYEAALTSILDAALNEAESVKFLNQVAKDFGR